MPNATIMANVNDAGLQIAYQDLNSNLEQVHKKTKKGLYWVDMLVEFIPFSDNMPFIWTGMIGIVTLACAGVVVIAKKRGVIRPSREERQP